MPKPNTAPYFISPLKKVTVNAGEIEIYELPQIKDEEGDDWIIKTGNLPEFISLQSGTGAKLVISPKKTEASSLEIITVTLSDELSSNSYNLEVEIVATAQTENVAIPSDPTQTLSVEFFTKVSSFNKAFKYLPPDVKKVITCRIRQIDNTGLATLSFD